MDTTSTLKNGSNLSILISLLLATCVIVCLLAMGGKSAQFSTTVSRLDAQPFDKLRVDGAVQNLSVAEHSIHADFCDENACIQVRFNSLPKLNNGDHAILIGVWKDNVLWVSDSLKRCDAR